jgi:DNA polymerase I-like protein with 3'-5' exonuclease and polymerase domains
LVHPSRATRLARCWAARALDIETKDDRLRVNLGSGWPFGNGCICGISVAYRADGDIRAHYFPLRHPDSKNFDPIQVYSWLAGLIASGVRFVTQNGVYDWGWLRTEAGIVMPPSGQLEELGALAAIIDENRFSYSLDSLCAWRGLPGKDETILRQAVEALGAKVGKRKNRPQAHIWRLPARFVGAYAEADAANTMALFESLNPILDQEGTRGAYRLEVDLLPMVLEMRLRGVRIDVPAAEQARDLLLQRRDVIFAELSEKLGTGVGMEEIGRPKWLAETFDRLSIKYPHTEKGAPSFTVGWMPQHPHWLPQLIVKADKYNNAATNVLQRYILDHVVDGRIHAEIHPHRSDDGGARSSRFSYSDPPLQLMPSRDAEITPLVRGVFLPEEGEVWAKPDLSQQEFRILLHYAAQCDLPKARETAEQYRNNPDADFHAATARMTGLDRQTAKAVNFGRIYGAGIRKFAAMIGKPESEARLIYARYDRDLPFVQALSELCQRKAARQGFLTLYDGARRHFNEWQARGLPWAKGAGPCAIEQARERVRDPSHPWYQRGLQRVKLYTALNALVQGTGARHTKLWMRAVWREGIVPLLQMHDALECSVGSFEQAELVARLGCEAVSLAVPMRVDLKFGRSWADATHGWAELHGDAASLAIEGAHIEIAASAIATPELEAAGGAEDESDAADAVVSATVPAERESEPARICVHCRREPPDGLERISAHNGGWLHPQCVEPFLRARMAEEGIPWESPTQSKGAPPSPPPPPKEGRGGNGPSDGFELERLLRPTNGRENGENAYPHGEHAGPSAGPSTAEYIYRNAAGRLHMRVVRTAGKSFPTYHWSGGKWVSGWPKEVVPYRLPELLAAPADAVVLVCEGEKDVETASRYGFVATTNPGGAGKWQAELAQYFQGKQRICIVEDNDTAGAKNTAAILRALRQIVPTIGVVRFPELRSGGDLSDYFAAGGSKPYLVARIEAALKVGVARPYVLIPASEVDLENVSWVWPGHLAHGALELLTGDPDLGKSQIHLSYAACATRGTQWPDGFPGSDPQQVLLVTAEDNYANTVGPRAVAAGVDLTKLFYLKGLVRNGKHEIFLLSSGLQELEQVLLDHDNIGLVLVDPITAYMGSPASGRFDSHKATDVRGVLGPLKDLAERHRVAISAITHPPKGAKASPLDSYIGSQAYIAAARIAHLCVPETEPGLAGAVRNTGRVFFTQVKNNIGVKAPTLAYRLDTKEIGVDRFGAPLNAAPFVAWEGTVDVTSVEALALVRTMTKTKVNPVQEFLRDILANGPVLQKMIIERGAAKGFSLDQLRRQRDRLGARSFKRRGENLNSPWMWALPEHLPADAAFRDESEKEE